MAGRNSGGRSTTSSHPSVVSFDREVNIVERCWEVLPTGSKPKAGLVVIHGGNWHSGWFGELGDLLSSAEYSIRVSAPDLISHGLSDDAIPGYRAYCPDFLNHAEEVGAAIARARAALPNGCPLFVLGESMGGLCALQHLILERANDDTTDTVDGVILCGALLQVAPAVLPPKVMVVAPEILCLTERNTPDLSPPPVSQLTGFQANFAQFCFSRLPLVPIQFP
ncbi:unnamed protein product [Ectocarpus sp. 13 AM-2016]